jgi:oligopeptidase B
MPKEDPGGLLMGVIVNEAPELYNGSLQSTCRCNDNDVDDSIPLTTGEYDEWGNKRSITTTCDHTSL